MDYPARSPERYASGAPTVMTYTIALDSASTSQRIDIGGSSIWVADASDISAKVTVKFNNQRGGTGVPLLRGTLFSGVRFEYLFADWDAQAGKWIKLVICDRSDLLINNPDQAFSEIGVTKPTTLNTVTDVTLVHSAATQILPADSTRRSALIGNLHTNADIFRIGDSNVAADRGIQLSPGETIEVVTTEAIYGYNPAAALDQDVSIMYNAD